MSDALVNLNALSDRFASLDARWILVALLFHIGNLGCRAIAWRAILSAAFPAARIRVIDVGAAYAAGVAANAYLPARGGEAVKIALVRLRIPGSNVTGVGASSGVVLLFDAAVGASLIATAWALGLVPAVPHPSLPAVAATGSVLVIGAAVVAVVPRLRPSLRQGMTILATPGLYLRRVVPLKQEHGSADSASPSRCCRPSGCRPRFPIAGLVVVASGVSTLVPATPGGAGTQQLLIVIALQQVASAGSALSFSIGMQVGVTVVNTVIGLTALMVVFGTLRPAILRAGLRQ